MVLDGEFEFETSDRESNRERKGLGAHKELDVRKLLFSRKKATIDDRRRMIEFEEKRLKQYQDKKTALLMRHFKP